MYIDVETISTIAKVIGSLAVIGGVLVALYKFVERDKKQSELIKGIQKEQTMLCYHRLPGRTQSRRDWCG